MSVLLRDLRRTGDLNVLISSAGRRVSLMRAFRDAGTASLHACDLQPDFSAACQVADRAYRVPRCDDPGFIDRIAQIVGENDIGLIVPTIDTELAAYAAAADRLAGLGAFVHVSPPEVIAVVRDKLQTMQVLADAGVPVPDSCSPDELRAQPDRLGWPVFGKPVGGSASRGLGSYRSLSELPVNFPEPMMFQPQLRGPEFTVNMFIDRSGQLRCVIPHERLQIRAGEVEKGVTRRRDDLHRIAAGIAHALPAARGVLCFQVIDDTDRGPQVIEINARFGGGYPLAHRAGARFADWLVQEMKGQVCQANNDWKKGVTMLRYDDAVFIE